MLVNSNLSKIKDKKNEEANIKANAEVNEKQKNIKHENEKVVNKQSKMKKINNCLYIAIVLILLVIMSIFISMKQGFHEDEIFSYGSSNYTKDNIFESCGDKGYINLTVDEYIKGDSFGETLKNSIYYLKHPSEFKEKCEEKSNEVTPIWKTSAEAKDYVSVDSPNEVLNLFSIYYNQSSDSHPPLFYFLVNVVCSCFYGTFSKYAIFILNSIFFVLTAIVIKKMMKLLNKDKLSIPILLIYGLSIGAISTVIYQRMYMMLTFFVLYYIYLNLQVIRNDYVLSKSLIFKICITVLLGYLTQYYFCIYALIVSVIMGYKIYKKKGFKVILKHIGIYVLLGLIGVIIYPPAIYHVFFSTRGISNTLQYGSMMNDFIKVLFNAFSLNYVVGILLIAFIIITSLIMIFKNKNEQMNLLLIPSLFYMFVVSYVSPYPELRYIMATLPIIVIMFVLNIDMICKEKNKLLYIILTICIVFNIVNLFINKPLFLFEGYNNYLDIANENKDLNFVYIIDNDFNHLQDIEEFMIYNKSFIVNTAKDELKYLDNNYELENSNEFIVSIKSYMNKDEIMKKVLEYSKYNSYTEIYNGTDEKASTIYKVIR